MAKFIELDVSVFDPQFTLDPFPQLQDLYARNDILALPVAAL